MTTEARLSEPIAIVSMGAKFPGRGTTEGFWRDICEGADAVTEVPPGHWLVGDYYDPDPKAKDMTYSKHGAFIPAFPFEPMEFGIPPNMLEATDTAQLIALYVAKQVLADAMRAADGRIDKQRISVILGVGAGSELMSEMSARMSRPMWLKALREEGVPEDEAQAICERIANQFAPWRESTFPGLLGNVVAGRIANRLDLGGTNFTADAACASSLAAIRHGVQELRLGESDLVLSGGSDALNTILMYMCFSKTPAMSPTGRCRPFSTDADGTIMGEGAGILALRRVSDAERDGNEIYALIRGVGSSSDGRASSVYAPRSEGQAVAIRRAFSAAGYSPRTVELAEAHGTGTRAGDAAEFAGLKAVFGAENSGGDAWCALGSVKSQIGHTKCAAGAAGVIKAAMALHQKVLPPTINVSQPNPKLGVEDSPFYLNAAARPWIRGKDHPRRASLSSFGFGGTNFHIAMEEYVGTGAKTPRYRALPAELFLFSGRDRSTLVAKARSFLQAIACDADLPFHARQSQIDLQLNDPCRASIVAGSLKELAERITRLEEAVENRAVNAGPDVAYALAPPSPGRLAVLFAGQGSQYLGMGAELAIHFEACRSVWDEAADLPEFAGAPLHEIAFPPATFDEASRLKREQRLIATENAQPAIGAMSLAHWNVLRRLALKIDALGGHSFGEIMALAAAGCFTQPDALKIARRRGLAMREASKNAAGAMTAVQAARAVLEPLLREWRTDIVIANDNAATQAILSGRAQAIASVEEALRAKGFTATRLPVSTAFHSPLVAGAAQVFGRGLDAFTMRAPAVPVYANTTARPYPADPAVMRRLLAEQLALPVRFREMIEKMYEDGVRSFVEAGPGSVLTGLVDQILGDRPHIAVSLDHKRTGGVTQLLRAVGRLVCAGHPLDLATLWIDAPAAAPQPQPSKHAVWMSGANFGRPYPPKGGAAELPAPNPPRASERGEVGASAARRPDASAIADAPISSKASQETTQRAPAAAELRAETSEAIGAEPPEHETSTPVTSPEDAMQNQAIVAFKAMHDTIAREHRFFLESVGGSHMAFLRTSEALLTRAIPVANLPTPQEQLVQEQIVNDTGNRKFGLLTGPTAASATIAFGADNSVNGPIAAALREPDFRPAEAMTPKFDAAARTPWSEPSTAAKPVANGGNGQHFANGDSNAAGSPAGPIAISQTVNSVSRGAPAPSVAPVDAAAPTAAAADLVRSVVAEKTGYPAEMLNLDMDLEAELGIDSIKQVEILSALREKMPDMPEIDPSRLGELRTLGAIAMALGK